MDTKKLTSLFGFCLFSAAAMAQFTPESTLDERIGGDEDHIKEVRGNISLYQEYYANQNWDEALPFLLEVIKAAPAANNGVYAAGPYIIYNLINAEKQKGAEADAAKINDLFDKLMMIYDTRLANLDALNSWQKPGQTSTKGDVLMWKAYYYDACAPDAVYDPLKCYGLFSEAIQDVNENGGKDIQGQHLQSYFNLSYGLYKQLPKKYGEQFLNDYLLAEGACNKMLAYARSAEDAEKAQKIINEYDPVFQYIEGTFAASGAADRDKIIEIFTPKVEENKDNLDYLNRALTVMAANNADDSEIYYKAAELAYNIQPSYQSAIGTAQKYTKEGKAMEAIEYYNKALELASDNAQRGQIALKVATAMMKATYYGKATEYINKAIEYNPDQTGRALYLQAQVLAKEFEYDKAIKACDDALAADISIQGPVTRLRANIADVKVKAAANAAAKAEYDAYMKKKKEEDDFWNGRK